MDDKVKILLPGSGKSARTESGELRGYLGERHENITFFVLWEETSEYVNSLRSDIVLEK